METEIKELEKEIREKEDKLSSLKYSDYESAKKQYAAAQENYQDAYKKLMSAKQHYLIEMNSVIRSKSTSQFFFGRGF